jgi:hypothetical protein
MHSLSIPGQNAAFFTFFATTAIVRSMQGTICIGLVFSHTLAYCRGVLRGIKCHAETASHWTFLPVSSDLQGIRTLLSLRPSAVIAHVFSEELAQSLSRLRVPIVNVCGVLPEAPLPRIGVDDHRCGGPSGRTPSRVRPSVLWFCRPPRPRLLVAAGDGIPREDRAIGSQRGVLLRAGATALRSDGPIVGAGPGRAALGSLSPPPGGYFRPQRHVRSTAHRSLPACQFACTRRRGHSRRG